MVEVFVWSSKKVVENIFGLTEHCQPYQVMTEKQSPRLEAFALIELVLMARIIFLVGALPGRGSDCLMRCLKKRLSAADTLTIGCLSVYLHRPVFL